MALAHVTKVKIPVATYNRRQGLHAKKGKLSTVYTLYPRTCLRGTTMMN
jgi:hypothetical protein